ncbi:hypothetical protein K505DRAFT_106650 [Melanomma pulvis-pyrius CBS 109.77]|uniref:Uncharacterized protein n=1 Tax=Melanomma pulvis-pyrius CBS 109.77 TaxID=1314802 RepID=A0A6A6XPV3_9PLEO|nr:hypothetical protein K505DRAFT_106650 [Melanomma pulvis-pyrius CBS 109.77]
MILLSIFSVPHAGGLSFLTLLDSIAICAHSSGLDMIERPAFRNLESGRMLAVIFRRDEGQDLGMAGLAPKRLDGCNRSLQRTYTMHAVFSLFVSLLHGHCITVCPLDTLSSYIPESACYAGIARLMRVIISLLSSLRGGGGGGGIDVVV